MGKKGALSKKLNSWLGRSFKATTVRSYLTITISRLTVLRNQRRVRWEQAQCDVADLLRQGHHDRALLRTEYIIKEQNMLDAFDMVESYCQILSERADLLESHRECPDELREAISSLVFADSRCGQLPELHEVRLILASRLGKEFIASAVELRNSCGVNTTIIQKLSTKQPSVEMKRKVVKDMAAELGIDLHLQEPSSEIPTEAKEHRGETSRGHSLTKKAAGAGDDLQSESVKAKQKYKDATSAAQAAFESAAYAAAAARAAVELSRSESQNRGGSSGQSTPRTPQKATTPDRKGSRSLTEKAQPFRTYSSGSECSTAKPVVLSSEGELASPSSSKSGDIPWQRETTRGYDRIVGEKSSDEEGVAKLKVHSQTPAIEPSWRAVPGNPSRRMPYEDTSSSDDDEIIPRKTALQRSNQERRHQELPKSGLAHWEEEDDEEVEEGPAARQAARLKEEERPRIRETPLQKRLGMEKRPVSMRTRRSAF